MLQDKLARGEPVFGTMLRVMRNPAVAAIAREAGWDFIMLDMEHGAYGMDELADVALAGRLAGLGVMVRVPELSRGCVSRALDMGACGVMVPMVETEEQARLLVGWAKYPPLGGRGLSSTGGHTAYRTMQPVGGMAEANRCTLAIAQIETRTGAQNAPGIAAVPGLDALLVGPNDLAVSLGKPGDLESPEECEAIERIAAAARAERKLLGIHASSPVIRRWASSGLRLIMNGIDSAVLATGMKRLCEESRALVADEAGAS